MPCRLNDLWHLSSRAIMQTQGRKGMKSTHVSDVNFEHVTDVGWDVYYIGVNKPLVGHSAKTHGPEWQRFEHGFDGKWLLFWTDLKANGLSSKINIRFKVSATLQNPDVDARFLQRLEVLWVPVGEGRIRCILSLNCLSMGERQGHHKPEWTREGSSHSQNLLWAGRVHQRAHFVFFLF